MRKLLVFFSMMVVAAFMALNLTSCGGSDDDDDGGSGGAAAPTIRILADIDPTDGYKVNITVDATDATTYAWDYGDGNTSTQSGNHTHTYTASGNYTISVTVTGAGGTKSDSKSVSIAASIEEIIAGTGDNGKTWVLTQDEASFAGKVGPGIVDNALPLEITPIPSGVVAAFGLGDEYNDEFTFYKDGTFKINVQNNQAVAGFLYGNVLDNVITASSDINNLPLCAIPYQNIDNGTWELSYADKTVSVYNEFKEPKVMEDVTFTFSEDDNNKVAEIKLSTGSYLGFLDQTYPAIPDLGITEPIDNSFYMLKEISPNHMQLAIAMSGVDQVSGVPTFMLPTFVLHLVLVPKP